MAFLSHFDEIVASEEPYARRRRRRAKINHEFNLQSISACHNDQ